MLILKIIGGFILLAILWGIGFIPEFLGMVAVAIIMGLISGGVASIFDWGDNFGDGFVVGIWIGLTIYIIYCILRIVSDEETITVFSDGSTEKTTPRFSGIVGLIVAVVTIIALIVAACS